MNHSVPGAALRTMALMLLFCWDRVMPPKSKIWTGELLNLPRPWMTEPDDRKALAERPLRVSALPALIARSATSALFAVSALVALGTFPSDPDWILSPVTAPFLIFALVIALFLLCLVPTEFFGSFRAP